MGGEEAVINSSPTKEKKTLGDPGNVCLRLLGHRQIGQAGDIKKSKEQRACSGPHTPL